MRSRPWTAVLCAAMTVIVGAPGTAGAAADDPSAEQPATAQLTDLAEKTAADMAARLHRAEQDFADSTARWRSADRAAFGALRSAANAKQSADEASKTAAMVAAQAYKGGMTDDLAPLLSLIDSGTPQEDLRGAQSFIRLADHTGERAILKRGRAVALSTDARAARGRLAQLRVALTDAQARLAAVRAEEAGSKLHAGDFAAFVDPGVAKGNAAATAAWVAFRKKTQMLRVPSFTAEQLRTRHLPRGVVRVKGAPGVARFRAGGQWVTALPNETVEAISYNIGALGSGYSWQTESGTDCLRLTAGAWRRQATDIPSLAAQLPLREATAAHPGDQVFLANQAHGLYQTGIAVDETQMIAADAATGAVRVMPIKPGDIWRVARPGADGTGSTQIPQGREEWRCGADPMGPLGQLTGTPRQIIEQSVLPWAMQHGFPDTDAAHVLAANQRHGSTVNGTRSDHQGPGEYAWAADISNGSSPTAQMDRLARDLATAFGMKWTGSGVTQVDKDGYRIQMLYRTFAGGNHFNHVHIGIVRTDVNPVPPPQF